MTETPRDRTEKMDRIRRMAPCGRGEMALERAGDISHGVEKPRHRTFWSLHKLGGWDIQTYVEDQIVKARSELDRVLCGPRAALGLEELRRIGGLQFFEYVHPIVGFGGGSQGHKDLWDHTKRVVEQSVQKPEVRWAALFHDVGKPRTIARSSGKIGFHGHELLGARMFMNFSKKSGLFSRQESSRIYDIILYLGRVESFEGEWTDSAVRRLMTDLGDRLEDVMALSSADITTGRDSKRAAILKSLAELGSRIEAVRATDAMPRLPKGLGDALARDLGIPRSRELGAIMTSLEVRLRSGEISPQTDIPGYVEIVRKERE